MERSKYEMHKTFENNKLPTRIWKTFWISVKMLKSQKAEPKCNEMKKKRFLVIFIQFTNFFNILEIAILDNQPRKLGRKLHNFMVQLRGKSSYFAYFCFCVCSRENYCIGFETIFCYNILFKDWNNN